MAIDRYVTQLEANAGQHDQFDTVDLDLSTKAGFELLQKEGFQEVDAGQLSRKKEKQRTEKQNTEDNQNADAETSHSSSMCG